mmetsp:Transcript_27944/g.41265  ORF Transcript_27944/g.41265 Transcript_27944/m.41265 type:complete len:291 (-) Transcript_27944:294-1166(-)|eukprot:CAMPEP_0194208904 /NCGR_PEP_ID=MMETSP0156-20130528/7218_1 /TAXON_ID=33649 /ORGANISM="Thalassionema nitzschioides, Strain L26-B" /LENGTH=290 /DNA_ID=CAMNT_0038935969 /DNA_START=51 /DNA_END=923 /DNA_ORIENTATION=-
MTYYQIHTILIFGYLLGIIQSNTHTIPDNTCSSFGSYPNLLNLSQIDRDLFHPVVLYPNHPIDIKDDTNAQGLATQEEILGHQQLAQTKRGGILVRVIRRAMRKFAELRILRRIMMMIVNKSPRWNIGRYDENRMHMYSSDLFSSSSKSPRTVHLGIDFGAPAGTSVYAFTDGIVHSSGYNAAYGDYGHVIIIEHTLFSSSNTTVFALYGHLSSDPKLPPANTRIRKGQRIGLIGHCHENGGWLHPHLHFQLSLEPPSKPHDMPGACSLEDRSEALLQYPDPRYVVGELY